ncbi:hypothetical protein [Bacillus wiedmannii]|nr:hypothetical protein [Bacillus wiedmannii]MED3468681.1 hypothetical protein [Bacillus thuringiensis]UOB93087.1 hypothetical protein BTI679_03610 [Bacillus wiedmannii]
MKARRDPLREWEKQTKRKKSKENFSTREIEDLMGGIDHVMSVDVER